MATIKGTSKKDKLAGTGAGDVILGLGGDDILVGAIGNDVLRGGTGNDLLKGEAGADKLYGDSGNDKLDGGLGNDQLFGGAGKDTLLGGAGNDKLDGGAGDDTMNGGTGNDVLLASDGADAMIGGAGIDVVDYSAATLGAGILLIAGTGSAAAAGDTFSQIEDAIGTKFGDTIYGTGEANRIWGQGGDDGLRGWQGADQLFGGDGDDQIFPGGDLDADLIDGGDGIDGVDYQDATAGVTVDLSTGATGGAAANDILKSIELVSGSDFDDTLSVWKGGVAIGGAGDDSLSGSTNSGDFILTTEFLLGGDGADQFAVHYKNGMDVIWDFSPGAFLVSGDKLVFKASEFAGIQHLPDINGVSTALVNYSGVSVILPNRAAPQFIFDQTSSYLYFDEDGIGTAFTPIVVAHLNGFHGALTHGGPLLSVDEFEII